MCRDWPQQWVEVLLEGLGKLKNSNTSSGI
jgi:hypothetical protein